MAQKPFNPPIDPDQAELIKSSLLKGRLEDELPEKRFCVHTKKDEKCGKRPPTNIRCSLCERTGPM